MPDEYDLLIYVKNGNRPQLLGHLSEVFPRHVQIHYGRYRREERFEAARRSRAGRPRRRPLLQAKIRGNLAALAARALAGGAGRAGGGGTGVLFQRRPRRPAVISFSQLTSSVV